MAYSQLCEVSLERPKAAKPISWGGKSYGCPRMQRASPSGGELRAFEKSPAHSRVGYCCKAHGMHNPFPEVVSHYGRSLNPMSSFCSRTNKPFSKMIVVWGIMKSPKATQSISWGLNSYWHPLNAKGISFRRRKKSFSNMSYSGSCGVLLQSS